MPVTTFLGMLGKDSVLPSLCLPLHVEDFLYNTLDFVKIIVE